MTPPDPAAPPQADARSADPRRLKVHRTLKRDVPYVPTDEAVVAAMLRFASVGPGDVVYDLGCGDGRIVLAAAKRCGARGVGVDIDPLRIAESREAAAKARLGERVRFHCQSFFDTDVRDATVVMLYLLPSINVKLRPKLLRELRPGARIVANYFGMGDWEPDMQADAHNRVLHQWIVPAWVAGTWKCVLNGPDRRMRMILRLNRRFQHVGGVAQLGREQTPISNGRLLGEHLTFKVYDPRFRRPVSRFSARIEGHHLRGTFQAGLDGPACPWGGVWDAGISDVPR